MTPRTGPRHQAEGADAGAARVLFRGRLPPARARIIGEDWLARLRAATDELVERSRKVTKSDAVFDLEPGHRPERAAAAPGVEPGRAASGVLGLLPERSVLPDVVADLVGPDVKFHHSKLNFKWAKGGEEVKWHYDISFWPHTNYSPLTVGTYLYDCGMEQGPLGVPARAATEIEPMLSQYDDDGKWVGCLSRRGRREARPLEGGLPARAGGLADDPQLPHAARLGAQRLRPRPAAAAQHADLGRRVPLHREPDQADARPVRSCAASARAFAHHDPRPCLIPPDWSGGYTSIFALQQEEEAEIAR